MAARREKGFYSTLSSVSSVDILPSFGRKIGRKTRGQFYEVDRLINKRGKGNEVSCHHQHVQCVFQSRLGFFPLLVQCTLLFPIDRIFGEMEGLLTV